MDAVRYYVALAMLAFAPGGMLLWFLIHPFVRFWRRVGVRWMMAFCTLFSVSVGLAVFFGRHALLAVNYGTNPWLMALAVPLLVTGMVLRKFLSRQLKPKVLAGWAEVAPQNYGSELLTGGIYARMRHPRYVQVILIFAACALFTNYLASYLFLAGAVVWVHALVPLEEKELRDRFGPEYQDYCARVPRFIPRLRRDKSPKAGKQAAGR